MDFKNRLLSGSEYVGLKMSTEIMAHNVGGYTAAARFTRVSQQSISRYASTNDEYIDNFMPLDVIADVEKLNGFPVIGEYLVGLHGYAIYKFAADGAGTKDLQQFGKMMNRMGDLFNGVSASLADDGAVSAAEIKEHQIIEHLTKLATDVLSMKADYLAKVEADE